MKRRFAAGLLCIGIIVAVCGCKSSKDITASNNAYSSAVTNKEESAVSKTEDIHTSEPVSEVSSSVPEKTVGSSSPQSASVSSETKGCRHDFRSLVLPPNCTTGGYTEHRCQDCGYEYTSDKTAPDGKHDFGKYLCEYCGVADPSRPIETLIVWMQKHGAESGNSQFFEIEKTVGNMKYFISTPCELRSQNYVSFEAYSLSGTDCFRVSLSDTADCTYSFYKQDENYSFLIDARIELKSSAARTKFLPEDFSYLSIEDDSYTKEEVYAQMADFFDGFINEINSILSSSGCGLSVRDFGFKLF